MSTSDRIKVVARFRPLNSLEKSENNTYLPTITNRNKQVNFAGKSFGFDQIFGKDTDQQDFYEKTAKPVINEVLQGKNSIIFAYGQTGSGKTFSMNGGFDEHKNTVNETRGVIPRLVEDLFESYHTVRSQILRRLRNVVIFEVFGSESFGQKIDFSKSPFRLALRARV